MYIQYVYSRSLLPITEIFIIINNSTIKKADIVFAYNA